MNFDSQIKQWIAEDAPRMRALEIAASLKLDDWCLAAGFVRNLVWDKVHQKQTCTSLNDIDLIYFNSLDCSIAADRKHQDQLKSISNAPWSVKNQARMHLRNSDKAYCSTADAMSYWVEIETAIGVKLADNNELELIAPFGLEALFNNTITINAKRLKPADFNARITDKQWLMHWPNLQVVCA